MTHPLRNIPAVSVFSFTWIFLIYQTTNTLKRYVGVKYVDASCCKHSADFAHRYIESMQQIVVNIQLLVLSQQILANFRVNLCSKLW